MKNETWLGVVIGAIILILGAVCIFGSVRAAKRSGAGGGTPEAPSAPPPPAAPLPDNITPIDDSDEPFPADDAAGDGSCEEGADAPSR